jgi:23S rRNA (adenine2030-N6)-methyltransferase
MYSYQHRYHAGNFADLHKHITLLAVLQYLHKKPGEFCVIDAFAGEGFYNLSSREAQYNQEYLTGYGLLENLSDNNPLCKDLYQLISFFFYLSYLSNYYL